MVKTRNHTYGQVDQSTLEIATRQFLQWIMCLFFGHRTIGIITTHGELKTRREECLMCGRTLGGEEPYSETSENEGG